MANEHIEKETEPKNLESDLGNMKDESTENNAKYVSDRKKEHIDN